MQQGVSYHSTKIEGNAYGGRRTQHRPQRKHIHHTEEGRIWKRNWWIAEIAKEKPDERFTSLIHNKQRNDNTMP